MINKMQGGSATKQLFDQIRKKNSDHNEYMDAILDGTCIKFYTLPADDEKDEYLQLYKDDQKDELCQSQDSSSEDEVIMIDNQIYINKINIDMLDDPNLVDKILDADKVVYPFSHLKVTFDYPCMDELTFDIDSESDKFTMHQLIVQVLRYYRFIYKAHLHFDLKSGEWKNEKLIHNNLLHTCVGAYLYDVNITALIYREKTKSWVVEYDNYV